MSINILTNTQKGTTTLRMKKLITFKSGIISTIYLTMLSYPVNGLQKHGRSMKTLKLHGKPLKKKDSLKKMLWMSSLNRQLGKMPRTTSTPKKSSTTSTMLSTWCGTTRWLPSKISTSGSSCRRVPTLPLQELLSKSTGSYSLKRNGTSKMHRRRPDSLPLNSREFQALETKPRVTERVWSPGTKVNLQV